MTKLANGIASLFASEPTDIPDREILSVSELINRVRVTVEGDFRTVAVVGEISSFRPWRSGHWYFDLKDDKAILPAVMFRNDCSSVPFPVKDGLKVIAIGKLSLYPPQSKVQLIVQKLEPVGKGALALAFEELKRKLQSEGLFAEDCKLSLPKVPRRVGLVTSPEGAALRDMMRILLARMPQISVLVSGTRVQGKGSAQEIADALERLDRTGNCDVIIIGRGGGSLEDLWSFNEEVVARAIFACQTPVVSAVGHETDFSIADFVADLRCATPTHAAQTVVPDMADLLKLLSDKAGHLSREVTNRIGRSRLGFERMAGRLPEPRMLLLSFAQKLDQIHKRLEQGSPQFKLNNNRRKFAYLSNKMSSLSPKTKFIEASSWQQKLDKRLSDAFLKRRTKFEERIKMMAARLVALSPLNVLARGYTLVSGAQEGVIISRARDAKVDDLIRIKFSDGEIDARVREVRQGSSV